MSDLADLKKNDLVERVRELESKVRHMEEGAQLGSLLNNIKTIVALVDPHGGFNYITPSFEWFTGYRREDLAGRKFMHYVHPDDFDKIEGIFRMALNLEGSSLNFPEFRYKHQRGAWIYLEGDINNRLHDPMIRGLVLNLYDVTQKKLFELDYARLLGSIRISSDSFMLCDNDGNIVFVNDATMRILEKNRSELIGTNISSYLHEEDLLEMFEHVGFNNGQIRRVEHRFITSEGREVPVESSIAVMKDGDKKSIGFVYITREIGDRKIVEEEIYKYRNQLEDLVEERTAELNQSMNKLRKTLEGIIKSMGHVLESRDQYTAGHQRRVTEVACGIAKIMGLPENIIEGLRMASMIHDVGKIYVPSEILNKHGKLDDAEFMLIKKHPQVGYDILKSIEFPWPIAEIVYQHHEKLDCSGYPRGLQGDQILLEAKILCVADVVEAMTIDRPYKAGLGLDSALKELEINQGLLYDPQVVTACVTLFRCHGYRFD
jgi:PAS domain S-box-containing protein